MQDRDAALSNMHHIIVFHTAYGRILGDLVCLAHRGFEIFNKVVHFFMQFYYLLMLNVIFFSI